MALTEFHSGVPGCDAARGMLARSVDHHNLCTTVWFIPVYFSGEGDPRDVIIWCGPFIRLPP